MTGQTSNNSIAVPKELKDKKIDEFIRRKVIEIMREIVSDPEYNLELSSLAEKRLQKSLCSKKKGKVVSLDEVMEKYM